MKPLFTLSGVVIQGQHRGKELGFPTANIPLNQPIPEGIYAAKLQVKGKTYLSATFIGSAKTFNETDVKAESYILDFFDDIYGEEVVVQLFHKTRGNKSFSSVDDLVSQMNEDIKDIRSFFTAS
jgi:riboflavin kinase/FMN adenylyltransferase